MTIYDYCHLGHARLFVAFDDGAALAARVRLEVTYVRNITDIDDKIIRRAAENGETIGELTERFIRCDARGLCGARPRAAGSRAARDRVCAADAGADRTAACRKDWRIKPMTSMRPATIVAT